MHEQIEQLLFDWEGVNPEQLTTLALRSAAVISRADQVPAEVFDALTCLEKPEPGNNTQQVYILTHFLRSLL